MLTRRTLLSFLPAAAVAPLARCFNRQVGQTVDLDKPDHCYVDPCGTVHRPPDGCRFSWPATLLNGTAPIFGLCVPSSEDPQQRTWQITVECNGDASRADLEKLRKALYQAEVCIKEVARRVELEIEQPSPPAPSILA